jgi:hypothetical protein
MHHQLAFNRHQEENLSRAADFYSTPTDWSHDFAGKLKILNVSIEAPRLMPALRDRRATLRAEATLMAF